MNTNIDKKVFGITEVHTPVDLDESTISRYATQVALGSKLKEMLDGDAEPVVKLTEKDVETTTETTTEKDVETTTEKDVETTTETTTEKDVETTTETVETPAESASETVQEEITVDEEGV